MALTCDLYQERNSGGKSSANAFIRMFTGRRRLLVKSFNQEIQRKQHAYPRNQQREGRCKPRERLRRDIGGRKLIDIATMIIECTQDDGRAGKRKGRTHQAGRPAMQAHGEGWFSLRLQQQEKQAESGNDESQRNDGDAGAHPCKQRPLCREKNPGVRDTNLFPPVLNRHNDPAVTSLDKKIKLSYLSPDGILVTSKYYRAKLRNEFITDRMNQEG